MRSNGPVGLLAVVLLALLSGSPASAEVLERILAVVDGRPLLLSEVRLLQQVTGQDEAAARAALVDEWLMFSEAARLPQLAPTPEEEARALASLELPRLGVDAWGKRAPGPTPPAEADLRRLARRQATIVKYVDFRFRPQVRVDEAAVAALYAAEFPSGTPALGEVAETLRARITERDLDRRIEEWIKELRTAADIRYN
jgi:hypothetical protein